jgi:hypothetical protein
MVNRSKSSINYKTIENTKEYFAFKPNSTSTCVSNGTEVSCYSGLVCQGDSTTISCPTNTAILSGNIKYGKWENEVCSGEIPNGPNSQNYSIPSSCIGQQSCKIDKDALKIIQEKKKGLFFDVSDQKQFQVSWTCPNNQMNSASAPPLPPPKKPTKNFTYDFYFDIDTTKSSFRDNCTVKTYNLDTKTNSLVWDGGSNTKLKGGSRDRSYFFTNKTDLVVPNNTWFSGWNISNVKVKVGGGNNSWCYWKNTGNLKGFKGGANNQAPLQQCNGDQCIRWDWKWNPAQGNDNKPCDGDNNTQEMRSYASYDAYQPKSTYWYTSAYIIPDTEPTVFQIIPLDNPTYPQLITYKVTYTIGFPNLITSDEITSFITKIGQRAFSPLAIGKSSEAAQKLVLDYCNNNGDSVTTTTCKSGLNVMELFVNSPPNPLPKYGCDTSYTNCQQGWMNYCDNPNSFTSTACQNFYASSYTPTSTINANVQALLQRNCAKAAVTNNVVNSPLSPDLQSVCGCYFPQQVYDDFKSGITKNNPGLSSFFSTPQCYYPMCNTNLSLQPNKAASAVCPSNTITQCITNTTNNLNAGGNISNVELKNNAVQNCAASSTSGASAKAESTPVSSKGGASPATPAATPAAAPAATTPATTPAAAAPAAAPAAKSPSPAAPSPAPEQGGLCIIL